jgi:hypothetical protein
MFRFSIRDVLWLTVVVAMAVGWWIDRVGLKRQENATVNYWAQKLADATNKPVHASTTTGEWLVMPKDPN